jgi:hypothetical protein
VAYTVIKRPLGRGNVMSETVWRQSLRQRIGNGLASLAENYPRGYLLVATAVALAGYGWLLLFPWLVVAGASGGYSALTGQPAIAWNQLLIWSAVTAGATLVTYRIARFRPALPAGIALERNRAPALFNLVGELCRHYRGPAIERVVISGAFELEILKTPCRALPVWSVSTLVIGLPLIESLSSAQFRCVLARRLGQFSKRYNRLVNWLNQLRRIWPQYAIGSEAAGPGFQPVRWFFSVFASFYDLVSLPAARLDELAADSYAMEVCSDEEVLEAITIETVCRLYLEEKYWPVYQRLTAAVRRAMPKPHTGMVCVLRAGLQGERGRLWFVKVTDGEPCRDDPMPSLAKRVENIGYLKPRMGEIAAVSAAVVYLGPTVEELDHALGREAPQGISPESECPTVKSDPRAFMASLTRRLRRRDAPEDAPGDDNHLQIPSRQ